MFFACGVSAYSAAMFHLVTHAFFKALLFLGAGSVIHALNNEQDMRQMGGIYKKLPITYAMMWIGSLALAGIPPFAGFYSKDLILEATYLSTAYFADFAFILGITAAFFTAFYSARLLFMTFHNSSRNRSAFEHAHEAPKIMNIPLYILVFGAIFSGMIGYYPNHHYFEKIYHLEDLSSIIKFLPLIISVAAFCLSYIFYMKITSLPEMIAKIFSPIYKFLLNKWYFDEIYRFIFVRPFIGISRFAAKVIDRMIIDDLGPNLAVRITKTSANFVSKLHTGVIYHYALAIIIGFLGFTTYVLIVY